jgi:hypothetical protein
MRTRFACLGPLAAGVLLGAPASAETFEHKATAQALFDSGRALMQRGEFAEACPKLAESLRLDQGIGVMLWLADCWENTSRTASAWAMFREAASLAAQEKDPRERVARRRAAELEPRLTRMVLVVSKAAMLPGLDIERDGVHLAPTEIGVPIPVDPGFHTLAATAPDHERWSSTIDIAARREPIAITVPVLRGDAQGGRAMRTSAIVLASAGAVAVGVGAFLGLRAKTVYDRSNDDGHCVADRCDAAGTDARSSAFHLATASTVAFGIAGAALVGAGMLSLLAPSSRTVAVTPAFGVGQAAVFATHRF